MSDAPGRTALLQYGSGAYIIQIRGEIERYWEAELRMQVAYCETDQGPISTLSGDLPDQAALLGVLQWLSMWGYVILSVQYVSAEEHGDAVTR